MPKLVYLFVGMLFFSTLSAQSLEGTNAIKVAEQRMEATVYPNPAINDLTLEISHGEGRTYQFVIYNILGSAIKSYEIDTRVTGKLDTKITYLKKGVYLYRILDESGKTLTTRRLMVIRP